MCVHTCASRLTREALFSSNIYMRPMIFVYPGAAPARGTLTHALRSITLHFQWAFTNQNPRTINHPIPSHAAASQKNPDQSYRIKSRLFSSNPKIASQTRLPSECTDRQSIRPPQSHDGGGQSLQPSRSPAATYVNLHRRRPSASGPAPAAYYHVPISDRSSSTTGMAPRWLTPTHSRTRKG